MGISDDMSRKDNDSTSWLVGMLETLRGNGKTGTISDMVDSGIVYQNGDPTD